jgi:hypothetical protein
VRGREKKLNSGIGRGWHNMRKKQGIVGLLLLQILKKSNGL